MNSNRIKQSYILSVLIVFFILFQITSAQKLPWAYNLYPYGREFGDNYTARDRDIGSGLIKLPFNISFMGHKVDEIHVHHAGYIAFQPNAKFSINNEWPHPQWPQIDDPMFIAPYYCRVELFNDIYATGEVEVDFYKDDNYGRVMYRYVERYPNFVLPPPTRNLTSFELLQKRSNELLNMAQDNIRDAISGVEYFVAEYAFVATWGNVTFLGINNPHLDERPRNSYQAVIVTDSVSNLTFAIFNYEKIEWAASTEFGGSASTGLSTTHAAKIGFNRGNGTEFFKVLPYSNNPKRILDLAKSSNVDYKGRFIFRIDEWIQPAGCKNEYSNGTLFIWPKFGNMLGGQEVNITGPCFGEHPVKDSDYFVPYENTFCKWGDGPDAPITRAEVITILRARCVVPLMFFTGRINLYVTTNNKISYEWKAEFTIVDPIRDRPKVELVNVEDWMRVIPKSKTLAIKWDKADLGWSRNETVDVQLYGYYEDEVPHWDFVQYFGERVPNTGYYEFNIIDNWALEQNRARRYRLGAVAVVMMSGGTDDDNPKRIWSQLQPLGWWRHNEMDILYDRHKILFGSSRGRNWMEDQCRWWHEYERWDRFWMYDLERCPCTINFATSDIGRFIPDPECNMDRDQNDPNNCLLHRGASHCVITSKPSVTGGSSRCCYDVNGNLMYTNDTKSGSTSDRFHINGIPPYNSYGRVPALSHYLHDMVPFFLCCEWSNLCDSYLFLRETADCKGYRYPKTAAIYGDPHVKTFDGLEYTFNGRGEFRLLRSTRLNFELQGRFEKPPNATFCIETSGGQINATRLTAIAAKEEGSDVIEVRARIHPTQTWRFKCDLFINGHQWFHVNATEEKMQYFRNVSIVSPYNDRHMSNLTIIFNTTQAAVQVSCGYGMLHVKFSAPPVMLYETEGLLGYWNNNSTDDLMILGGTHISSESSPQDIYKNFGMLWRIEYEKDSLFTYSGSYRFDKFHDRKEFAHTWMQHVPWYRWDDPNFKFPTKVPFSESQMSTMCDGDEQCLFDTKAMGSLEIGESTRNAHRYYKFLHEAMKPTNSCGIMSIKGGIRKTDTGNYLAGSRMTITCAKYYTFGGYGSFVCHPNGTWLPANGVPLHKFNNWPYCEHYHITALKWTAIGISIIFAILMIISITCFFMNYKRELEYLRTGIIKPKPKFKINGGGHTELDVYDEKPLKPSDEVLHLTRSEPLLISTENGFQTTTYDPQINMQPNGNQVNYGLPLLQKASSLQNVSVHSDDNHNDSILTNNSNRPPIVFNGNIPRTSSNNSSNRSNSTSSSNFRKKLLNKQLAKRENQNDIKNLNFNIEKIRVNGDENNEYNNRVNGNPDGYLMPVQTQYQNDTYNVPVSYSYTTYQQQQQQQQYPRQQQSSIRSETTI